MGRKNVDDNDDDDVDDDSSCTTSRRGLLDFRLLEGNEEGIDGMNTSFMICCKNPAETMSQTGMETMYREPSPCRGAKWVLDDTLSLFLRDRLDGRASTKEQELSGIPAAIAEAAASSEAEINVEEDEKDDNKDETPSLL